MKKSIVFTYAIFCFSIFPVLSQDIETEPDQLDISGVGEVDQPESLVPEEKRLKTNVEVGTSFIYSPRNFYGPSYYVAPSLSYLVTPRFSLSAGVGFEYSSIYPLYNTIDNGSEMLPMTRAFLFARGSYLLTDRIIVTGSVYKTMNDVPKLNNYSRPMNYSYQGVDLGIQYQINQHFSVGFHMRMSNMNYPSSGLIPPDALVPIPGFY